MSFFKTGRVVLRFFGVPKNAQNVFEVLQLDKSGCSCQAVGPCVAVEIVTGQCPKTSSVSRVK